MIRTLKAEGQTPIRISQARADNQQERGASAEPAGHDASETDPEYLSKPVDRGSKSAPIVVLREISEQKTLGYRRLLGHGNLDLVQLQLLDEQVASELIELYVKPENGICWTT
jgi:hypothetical protein